MNGNTTFHHDLMSIITSIGCKYSRRKGSTHTVSLKDRQAPLSHHSFSQRGLCLAEIPDEEFAADIPRGAPNLCPVLSGGKRQSTDSHDLLGSYHEGIFISITGNNSPKLGVYPRPVHYRQRRATSRPGHCDASKLSCVAGQCGPTIRFWDEGLSRAAPFGTKARLRQPISGVKPALRCLVWDTGCGRDCARRFWWKAALALSHSGCERSCAFVSGCGRATLDRLIWDAPAAAIIGLWSGGPPGAASWEPYHHMIHLMDTARHPFPVDIFASQSFQDRRTNVTWEGS